jgi:hypothetical protein
MVASEILPTGTQHFRNCPLTGLDSDIGEST